MAQGLKHMLRNKAIGAAAAPELTNSSIYHKQQKGIVKSFKYKQKAACLEQHYKHH